MSDDDPVVDGAKQGHPDAWRELYRAHAGRLVAWLSARPGRDAAYDPEDVAAEAWLVAAEKIDTFTGTADDFAGWLFGIARNLASNSQRTSRRRATDPAETLPEPTRPDLSSGPEPQLVAIDWVRRVLGTLPPREREVVACLDVVQLDVAATARALDMTQVAVRVAHHRAMKRLRREAGRSPGGPPLGLVSRSEPPAVDHDGATATAPVGRTPPPRTP